MTHRTLSGPTRRCALALAGAAALVLAAAPALAQDYPNKPVRLVIPFPAGGSSDGIGRQIADKLGPILKQSVVVENKGGAGGMIGADAVAKSAPDGYTLVLVDVFHTSTPIYTRKMPYDAVRDFTPVSLVGRSPAFLVSHPGFEAKTARDALAYGKANPGKLTMAIAGTGSVVVDLFRARSGVQFQSVPYRGSSPALIDLISGQVNVMITTMASAGAHVKSGKLRALAVTGSARNPDFPDVPTFNELGVQGMDYEQWFGVMGPANLPKPVVDKLAAAMEQVLRMPDVRERLVGMAMEVAAPGPDEMKRKVESDAARWVKLAQELDIKPLD
ncbi:tripartite tricarboxylate transporter substrate binding protein [Caenimonas sedimenti]|uniref:Tripartite tricarboxylate transporter substrate binding protein n=1 Tax=Caenimonas sedimenti TaxID=2596921 RepID=A0A562ZQG9_9BURK|nr:tripartite tricarboxylate transporter substrate binding protein [Caenimonas sedimenti]TWO70596.1 tripartite tricarboxylate transporter substrate binding protein [Caenimonas sedimenti]